MPFTTFIQEPIIKIGKRFLFFAFLKFQILLAFKSSKRRNYFKFRFSIRPKQPDLDLAWSTSKPVQTAN